MNFEDLPHNIIYEIALRSPYLVQISHLLKNRKIYDALFSLKLQKCKTEFPTQKEIFNAILNNCENFCLILFNYKLRTHTIITNDRIYFNSFINELAELQHLIGAPYHFRGCCILVKHLSSKTFEIMDSISDSVNINICSYTINKTGQTDQTDQTGQTEYIDIFSTLSRSDSLLIIDLHMLKGIFRKRAYLTTGDIKVLCKLYYRTFITKLQNMTSFGNFSNATILAGKAFVDQSERKELSIKKVIAGFMTIKHINYMLYNYNKIRFNSNYFTDSNIFEKHIKKFELKYF